MRLRRHQEDADVVSVASTTSSSTARRHRESLPVHLLAQLCEDIETYGGIQKFSGSLHNLKFLLNHLAETQEDRRELYKEQRDPIRRRIQLKVYQWQKLEKQQYKQKVLDNFDVVAAENRDCVLQIPKEEDINSEINNLEISFSKSTINATPPAKQIQFDSNRVASVTPLRCDFAIEEEPRQLPQELKINKTLNMASGNELFKFDTSEDTTIPALPRNTCTYISFAVLFIVANSNFLFLY